MWFSFFRTIPSFPALDWFSLVWFIISWFPGSGFCFGFLMGLAGGVCCWKFLANRVKFLLGSLLGVVGLVSGSGFLVMEGVVSTWFGFGLGIFFLVVLAKPLCLMIINLESTVTNCCWFR